MSLKKKDAFLALEGNPEKKKNAREGSLVKLMRREEVVVTTFQEVPRGRENWKGEGERGGCEAKNLGNKGKNRGFEKGET